MSEENEFQKALERLSSVARYGIGSDDNDIMNPENYKKEMKQHYKDVRLLERLVKDKSQEYSLADGMITRYEELENETNALRKELERLRAVLQSIADSTCCDKCNQAKIVALKALAPQI